MNKSASYFRGKRNWLMIVIVLFVVSLISIWALYMRGPTVEEGDLEEVELELIAEGFVSPVGIAYPEDDSGRLFIVDQVGKIWIISNEGEVLDEPFLDISDKMVGINPGYDERGLLDMAFHPDYADNGKFYVYYSAPLREGGPSGYDHTSHVSEFTVSSTDPNRADVESERVVIEVDEPQSNHNGGQLIFGHDDYMYISLGDGGAANDVGRGHPPEGNGQNESTLLGSILRIDVDGETPYDIPEDNPFVGRDGKDEIYAYGFRNPWRMSFDSEGRLFVGDVGQNMWEEVNIVEKGMNYGWNIREGTHCFDPEDPNDSPDDCPVEDEEGDKLEGPIIEYKNRNNGGIGLSVIGGHVYEGEDLEEYEGLYIFGDWSSSFSNGKGKLFYAEQGSEGLWKMYLLPIEGRDAGELDEFLLGIGEDRDGEIYLLTTENSGPSGETGKVYRLVSQSSE